jgi:hypothetical protein
VVAGQQVWHDPPPGVAGKSYVTQDTAYRARDLLEIRISDLRKVGAVIDTLLALGLTEMTGPKFLATTTAEAREVALRDATKLARQQAETMAEASGMVGSGYASALGACGNSKSSLLSSRSTGSRVPLVIGSSGRPAPTEAESPRAHCSDHGDATFCIHGAGSYRLMIDWRSPVP